MAEAGPQQNSSRGEAGRDWARYPSEADGWPSHLLFGRHSSVIILYSGLLLSDAPPAPPPPVLTTPFHLLFMYFINQTRWAEGHMQPAGPGAQNEP